MTSKRADALNALTLVENIARLVTQGLFGFVFASLAGIGKAYLTFFANAVSLFPADWGRTGLIIGIGCCTYRHGGAALIPLPTEE